jgi:hypothetical protein
MPVSVAARRNKNDLESRKLNCGARLLVMAHFNARQFGNAQRSLGERPRSDRSPSHARRIVIGYPIASAAAIYLVLGQ